MALARITARAHAVAGAMTIGSALAQATAQATSSNTPDGEQYLVDVAPYNAASRNFGPRHPTVVFLFSVVQDAALPLINASQNFDSKLQLQHWPTRVHLDIDSLVRALDIEERVSPYAGTETRQADLSCPPALWCLGSA